MDVNSAFLNDYISEKIYVDQPPTFAEPHLKDHVNLIEKRFIRGKVDNFFL